MGLLSALVMSALVPVARAQTAVMTVKDASNTERARLDSDGGFVVTGAYTGMAGTIPATGTGTRLMWYPGKAAFRAGRLTVSSYGLDGSVGLASVAMGENARAQGNHGVALGRNASAGGFGAVALGEDATASGSNSVALGVDATAGGTASVAIGEEVQADDRGIALGWDANAIFGAYTVGIGHVVNASAGHAFALGSHATANDAGAFVYGDGSTTSTVSSSAANQATWRVAGGFRIMTNANGTLGVAVGANGTSWSSLSDSTRKERFRRYDPAAVLTGLSRLRVGTWNYRGQHPATTRHWGPMAQDFHREFGRDGVGTIGTDTTISTQDADGVLFAAAQALEVRTRALVEDNAALRARLDALERRPTQARAPLALHMPLVFGLMLVGLVTHVLRRLFA